MTESGTDQPSDKRGRGADAPGEIPRVGWRDVLFRVKQKIATDNVPLVSAGIAFYGLLALFPGVAGLVSVYGLVADPSDITDHIEAFPGLPAGAKDILTRHLHTVAASSEAALSMGFIGALLLSIWSASRGTKALLVAMNIAYNESETRGFIRRNVIAMLVTAAVLVTVTAGLLIIAILPTALRYLGLPILETAVAQSLPWLFLVGGYFLCISLLYRYGPNRSEAKWRWITPGAVLATFLWLLSSAVFSFYVASFGRYNEAYGAVGAVVVLLLWFWISAFVVIMGAEIDAETEHQTNKDTTVGPSKRMGERGAYVADHEARVP